MPFLNLIICYFANHNYLKIQKYEYSGERCEF
jgi:hypothetical protein